ncbi:hypothetical protein FNL56_27170 [Tardiphaga sp. vice304]|uniref:hypothetical protein n=1 Tax=Tardiphaga sp. vice304 TaxID=2592817 RepID=UPI0011626736|nr:hypothetical protein [Tardiphaga sp. vice304]QDM29379.1 hypothetical protein FNL56_27170 [Tardiphaga sp. vice304]
MLEKLTTNQKKSVWINLDMIVRMESINVQDGYPSTQLFLFVGGSVDVFESPEEIAILANFQGYEDDGSDDGIPEDKH